MDCFLDLGLASWCVGAEEPKNTDENTPPDLQTVFSFEEDSYVDCSDGLEETPETPATQPLSSPSELTSESSGYSRRHKLKPLFGDETVAGGHGTTTILVLSRDDDDEIPDMSPSDDASEAGSYRSDDESAFRRPKPKLVNLTDVLAEVLRVVMFFLYATGRIPKPILSRDHQRQTVKSH